MSSLSEVLRQLDEDSDDDFYDEDEAEDNDGEICLDSLIINDGEACLDRQNNDGEVCLRVPRHSNARAVFN